MSEAKDELLYYVSAWNCDNPGPLSKYVALLGPFDTHQEALDQVDIGHVLALEVDVRASWYAYGTVGVLRKEPQPEVVFTKKENGDGYLIRQAEVKVVYN